MTTEAVQVVALAPRTALVHEPRVRQRTAGALDRGQEPQHVGVLRIVREILGREEPPAPDQDQLVADGGGEHLP